MFSPLQACKYDAVLHVHYLKLQIHRPCRGEFLVYPCLLPPVKGKKKSIYIHIYIENTTRIKTYSVCAMATMIYLERNSLKSNKWVIRDLCS